MKRERPWPWTWPRRSKGVQLHAPVWLPANGSAALCVYVGHQRKVQIEVVGHVNFHLKLAPRKGDEEYAETN